MAIVRCENHPVDMSKAKHVYVKRGKPIGYPNTAVMCGVNGCMYPGLVWLTEHELINFNNGLRIFDVHTQTVHVKIEDQLMSLT